ncbi:protein phosphatases pp1 regulatory subunit, putative [Pediculus humanus corporis]|uniref:Dynein axonemal assembly factor 1 homolog n=1 Tax=Pediculus humanus subsp. corporis TaxID=121224 RepID=E0VR18_PEDHC|nr:protein phosphatases pp1 regulatory subunit, putative [Pediculus humanus corporis]EEB15824.1 protein phosphatases pp1 regulatory subunit, putative [Pediculus humanus corporis]
MDTETACLDLREPGVIDEKMVNNAIIEQGPKGEEGRLFKQQGIVYEEVAQLRLEYLDILKIDHLWMLTGLTKLQLCNNRIEKIENLHFLVNLVELDLSFNFIETIENLDSLNKLEILTFFQNNISELKNLDTLTNLTILSVGNNNIGDRNSVLYLRRFENLKSLNLAGNPVSKGDNFVKFIMAYLPQLNYYEYRLILYEEREDAREFFGNNLLKLEREESETKAIFKKKKREEEQEILNSEAFVEYIGNNHFFKSLFENDTDCQALLQMGDFSSGFYEEYQKNFEEIANELVALGLQQLELRKEEIARFEKHVGDAKRRLYEESRKIIENFIEQKNSIFEQLKEVLNNEDDEDDVANETSVSIQLLNENFKDLCHKTWTVLMSKELNLFERTEDVNGTYERSLTELVNSFVEGSQSLFTQIRQLQNTFNENLTDAANKFFTNYTVASATKLGNEFKNISDNLAYLLQDKEVLVNALSASHDYHLLLIDQREDKLITGVRTWLANLLENLVNSEINRHRRSIMEINHFLDIQKAELHSLLMTPMGLNLLPKDIQDALQM